MNLDGELVPENEDYFGPNSACDNSTPSHDTCRYRAYRIKTGDNKYELDFEWWRIMVARLVFVVIFEVIITTYLL